MDPLLLGAGAVALFFFLGRKKKGKPPPVEIVDVPDIPIPVPGKPFDPIPPAVIGGVPGYDWQPRNIWPAYGSILGGLKALGYKVPADFSGPRATDRTIMLDAKKAIKKFQADYKQAVKWLTKWPQLAPDQVLIDGKNAPRKTLAADGWMGRNTWAGFKWAYQQGTRYPDLDVWQDWVNNGRGIED